MEAKTHESLDMDSPKGAKKSPKLGLAFSKGRQGNSLPC